ncbi:MAG: phosphoribosylamine--glycine ligase [Candidatus Hydrothermia bacterium]
MRLAVIGKGGRENAIVHKISQSKLVEKIYAIPGNPGTAKYANNVDISPLDFMEIAEFVNSEGIELVIPGPELPISKGIKDFLESASSAYVFAPPQEATFLETSKIQAKEFMKRHNIPTANFHTFANFESASNYVRDIKSYPIVIKADGLAEGKGVVIAHSPAEAVSVLYEFMIEKKFGISSTKVVIEEFLTGIEYSVFVITDGKRYKWIGDASDYKKAYDGDRGPNTGGMGSVSPAPFLTEEMRMVTEESIIKPTIKGLEKENIPYVGFLYFGLIWTKNGPMVLEYNIRLGDPEAQVILPRLENDLISLIESTRNGNLGRVKIKIKPEVAICVVIASGGYPVSYETGKPIQGIDKLSPDVILYHAGTREEDGKIYTDGGRVLNLVMLGDDFRTVIEKIYNEVEKIRFEKAFYRRDIGDLSRFGL